MNDKVVIDTNILVYAYDVDAPEKQQIALEVLKETIVAGKAVLPAQVLAEFFVIVTQKIENALLAAEALNSIDQYIQSVPILPLTGAVVREAVRGVIDHQLSYWDAQIWAIAHLNQISQIITEDVPAESLIKGVQYSNPFSSFLETGPVT